MWFIFQLIIIIICHLVFLYNLGEWDLACVHGESTKKSILLMSISFAAVVVISISIERYYMIFVPSVIFIIIGRI